MGTACGGMGARDADAVWCAMWRRAVVLWMACAAAAQEPNIGVVEQPDRGPALAAAVDAALPASVPAVLSPLEPGEPLALPAAICAQASAEVVAAVCSGDERALRLANAAAARAGLPLLLVDPAPADATWEALALYPHPDVLAQAAVELCAAKGWRRAVLLHEGSAAGAALLAPDDEPMALLARQLPPPDDAAQLRNLVLVLKKSGAVNFIVWCGAECVVRVLDAAQRAGLLAERHAYIALALDLQTQDLEPYSYGGANLTALRLFDPQSDDIKAMMEEWQRQYSERVHGSDASGGPAEAGAAPASAVVLARLGAELAAEAWRRLALPPLARANCERGEGAFHADTLLNYIRSEEWGGAGAMSWEADGGRRAVELEVVELARGGSLVRTGRWSPSARLTWQRNDPPAAEPPKDSVTNRTFTILVAQNQPYVMMRESQDRLTGNDRYEGFCIELIQRLAELLHFNYTFVEQDGGYGTYDNVTKKWDGMLGRLIEDPDVDFAITDLTITAQREHAVDFTTPFMNLGIAILFRTPKQPEPELFAFLLPFSNEVWMYLGLAYVGTSLVLYVVGRLCHEEWQNPYPCIEEPAALENQFTLANALWFNLGAVLLQGSEIAPVAYSTRAVASVWWLFALVITSSYTANLATLLAQKSSNELIHNVQELADNAQGIDYGAKVGGSTYTFFEHSESELYQRMFEHMRTRDMPTSNRDGIDRVERGDYAFLMESTSIDYEVERNCAVTKVGSLLDSKGYGIAMKKDSAYRQALNLGLLNLQEGGILRQMQLTWWKEKHGGGACKDPDDRGSAKLAMRNFLGLFIVLVVGCALGVVASCCDLAWAAWRSARAAGEPALPRFWAELRFVFRFDQSVKPLQGPLSGSTSGSRGSRSPSECGSVEECGAEEEEARRARAGSGLGRGRRRSSMHAASVRLARHAARDSATPAPRSPLQTN